MISYIIYGHIQFHIQKESGMSDRESVPIFPVKRIIPISCPWPGDQLQSNLNTYTQPD